MNRPSLRGPEVIVRAISNYLCLPGPSHSHPGWVGPEEMLWVGFCTFCSGT